MPNLDFNPDVPASCPPGDAEPANHIVYRQVDTDVLSVEDFKSHAEKGKKCDPEDCKSWGCSVWTNLDAAVHARKLFNHFRRTYLAAGSVGPTDGVIKMTPNNRQPEHYTFWKSFGKDISGNFEIVMQPEGGDV